MAVYKEAYDRSIVRAIGYRVLAAITTTTIVLVLTCRIVLSIGVWLIESVVKVMCCHAHETMWPAANL